MTMHTRQTLRAAALGGWMLAMSVALPAPALAAKADADPQDARPAAALRDVGRGFEAARALSGAERLARFEQLDQGAAALARGHSDSDARAAILSLSGAIAFERGDYTAAERSYRHALDAEHGRFADDLAFAAIRSLEAHGRDAEAAREWAKWEKTYPSSPLRYEARLARVWNALRRGDAPAAQKDLAALTASAPWMAADARCALARAATLYLGQRPAEALAALGPRPAGEAALYLSAACQAASGSLLRAAASFQDLAERYPASSLKDPALFAKANTFLRARDDKSAASEFARVIPHIDDPALKAEAELRAAGAVFLSGANDSALAMLQAATASHAGTDVAARAQFLIGAVREAQGNPAGAIVEFNQVLTRYFRHSVAASAQYRVARCLDAMGRRADATGSYEAVVRGYPLEPEAPAAAYLAGVGLLDQQRPLAAAPYFQLVLDRYASHNDTKGLVAFASPELQELVEAALCLLELSYHRAGDLGQLSGAPHLLLQRMPPSRSPWRAFALLIDADAAASQARYPEAQATLENLMREFPDHPVGASATKLLAWTYARQGKDSLAIGTEERLLARYGAGSDDAIVSAALLDIAHERFNQKRYKEAAAGYQDFLSRYPTHPRRLLALYQAGQCYARLDRAGDAVDRWEAIVKDSAAAPIAERAWARAGDLYFQAERYDDARRCYRGLIEHFAASSAVSIAMLRLGQCDYNAGHDAAALERFAATIGKFPGTPAAREAQHGTELALYRLSASPGGEKELARLVEQFPASAFAADAQFKLARRAYDQQRWLAAAEGFRRVVSQFPSYSGADQAQFLLADAYAHAGNADDARRGYEQFLSFFPSSPLRPTAQFRLGLAQFEVKDYARAAVAFTLALEDSASAEVTGAARYNLALCHRALGQSDEARAELERCRAAGGGGGRAAEIAYQLGDLDEAAGQAAAAAREFQRALEARPSVKLATELAFRLGRCREQSNERDAALDAYRRAAAATDRDDPYRLSAVARCAALYETKHDYARAVEAYRDLIRNAKDRELVAAATGRVSQLEAGRRR